MLPLKFGAKVAITMAIRGNGIGERVKYWVRPDILNRIEVGEEAPRPKHYLSLVKLLEFAMVLSMILMVLSKMLIMKEVWSKSQYKSLVDPLLFN